MNGKRQVLGPALVGYSDYVGTAAAEDAEALIHTPSLYELAGVDRDLWLIVGIDLTTADDTVVTVYAVDRLTHGIQSLAEIEQLGWDTGEVPVTAFRVPDDQVEDFVNDAFKRISIRLFARPLRDHTFVAEST